MSCVLYEAQKNQVKQGDLVPDPFSPLFKEVKNDVFTFGLSIDTLSNLPSSIPLTHSLNILRTSFAAAFP